MVEPTSKGPSTEDKYAPKSRPKRDAYNHTFDEQRRQFLYEVIVSRSKIKDVRALLGS